ncbi:manganese efflux pump MntP family protein [Natroniella acetigena]|uniref:manganese efflux pump MntP n=1 Tax=Natroniella acetigena TaxID=52004 RepID=UPI002009F1FC|nr:manganese efflux pump MntP family protein [Natroniella acetigena]MCK8828030.1 manganese efflux pump MntP family protein [Natroniella acetigena]
MGFYEIIFIGIALGMDTLPLSIGVGIGGVNKDQALKFSLLVGVLHITLPLFGLYIGGLLGSYLGEIADYIGAAVLILLGVHMIYEELKEEQLEIKLEGTGFFLLPLSVSLDALAVGFSLGALGAEIYQIAIYFGAVALAMTTIGLTLGDRLGSVIKRAGLVGGAILIGFGFKMMFF